MPAVQVSCAMMTPTASTERHDPPAVNPFVGKIFSLQQLYAHQQRRDWMVKGVFCRGDIGMLYGESRTGKSFLVIDLLFALATGAPSWCGGLLAIPKPRVVIYCAGEGQSGLQKRMYAADQLYQQEYAQQSPEGKLFVVTAVPQLFREDDPYNINALTEASRQLALPSVDLVVIDTKHTATYGANENDNSDAAIVWHHLQQLQASLGNPAVCFVHHCGKDGNYRGASAYFADADFVIATKRDHVDVSALVCEKIRDGESFPQMAYALQQVDTPFDEGETSCVVSWQGAREATIVLTLRAMVQAYATHEAAQTPRTAREIADLLSDEYDKKIEQKKIIPLLDSMIALFSKQRKDEDKPQSRYNPHRYAAKVVARSFPADSPGMNEVSARTLRSFPPPSLL